MKHPQKKNNIHAFWFFLVRTWVVVFDAIHTFPGGLILFFFISSFPTFISGSVVDLYSDLLVHIS